MKPFAFTVPGPVGAALFLVPLMAGAAEHEKREHDAHEHGQGLLTVVTEGDELAIEFRMPAVNVVGFEHEPSTDEQRRAVEEALAVFRRADSLFVLPESARCRVEEVEVELAGMAHEEGEAHEHEKHDEHDKHDKHGEHDEHEGHDEEAHSELHGEYHFHCEAPDALDRLEVRLFEHLSNAEEIEAQIVTATMQAATDLRPGNTVLKLAR